MALQRPAWTGCFFAVWVLVLPAVILTHIGVGSLAPAITDLPDNVVKGFDEVFKFKYLEEDSKKIKVECSAAAEQCGVTCLNKDMSTDQMQKTMDAVAAKAVILGVFQTSLDIVQKIANDKYFGVDEFKATADSLNEITKALGEIPDTPNCGVGVTSFCAMYDQADLIVNGMAEVNTQLNSFKDSDAVKQFKENADNIKLLHILPYFLVLSLVFFSLFWYMNGICCCCKDGSCRGSLALIPFALFWLVAFIIYLIVAVAGYAMKNMKAEIEVPVLKGKPNLEQAIDHIQTNYPEFWKVVFADLEAGLASLYIASWFVCVCCLVAFFYTCCVCIVRPYQKPDDQGSS